MFRYLKALGLAFVLVLASCTQVPKNVHDLNVELNKAEKTLNVAIKTNRELYLSGVITIAIRRKVATVVDVANDKLLGVVAIAKNLTDANFASSKGQINIALQAAAAALRAGTTGNATIDALLLSAATALDLAVGLTASIRANDILPTLKGELASYFDMATLFETRSLVKGEV